MNAYLYVSAGLCVGLLVMPVLALVVGTEPAAWVSTVSDRQVWSAIGLSVGCASFSTLLAVLLGTPVGFLLARGRLPGVKLWQAVIDLPIVIPHPVLGLGLLYVFARRSPVGALFDQLGLQIASATLGIVLAMWTVSVPFVIKSARDGFMAVPKVLEQVAATLGASDARVAATVSLPFAWRSIRSGALLAWARAISEFGSVVILAYFPRTAPVLIWDRFSASGMGAAMAPALLLMLVCLSTFLTLHSMHRRGVAWQQAAQHHDVQT